MKLKEFIKKLKNISKKYGGDISVVMADNAPIVAPIFSTKYLNDKSVIITDEKS